MVVALIKSPITGISYGGKEIGPSNLTSPLWFPIKNKGQILSILLLNSLANFDSTSRAKARRAE